MLGLMLLLAMGETAMAQVFSYTTPLVASRSHVIGYVQVDRNNDSLDVTYVVTDTPSWSITKTYLHVSPTANGFPVNSSGVPDIQNFTYKTNHGNVTYYKYDNIDVTGMPYTYISANANVTQQSSCVVDTSYINSIIPKNKLLMRVQLVKNPAYFKTQLYDSGGNLIFNDYFYGNCVDLTHPISDGRYYFPYAVSSYSGNSALLSCLVNRPENLDLVNYLINQDYATSLGATGTEIQAAIWTLLDYGVPVSGVTNSGVTWNQSIVNAIIADAKAKGEYYIPPCNGYFVVLLDQGCKTAMKNGTTPNITVQQSIFWLPVNKLPTSYNYSYGECANAWAKGKKFNTAGWGQYFQAN